MQECQVKLMQCCCHHHIECHSLPCCLHCMLQQHLCDDCLMTTDAAQTAAALSSLPCSSCRHAKQSPCDIVINTVFSAIPHQNAFSNTCFITASVMIIMTSAQPLTDMVDNPFTVMLSQQHQMMRAARVFPVAYCLLPVLVFTLVCYLERHVC